MPRQVGAEGDDYAALHRAELKILKVLHAGAKTPKQIAAETGMKYGTVQGLLKLLYQDLWIYPNERRMGGKERSYSLMEIGLARAKVVEDIPLPNFPDKGSQRTIAKRHVEAMVGLLSEGVCVAASVLGESKETAAVEPLIRALQEPGRPWQWRCEVVWALGEIGDRRAVEPLIEALSDSSRRVAEGAAFALSEIKDLRGIKALIELLNPGSGISDYVDGLIWRMGKQAEEFLIQALRHENEMVRRGAVSLLGRIGSINAIPPLTEIAENESHLLKNGAKFALEIIRARAERQ